MRRRRIAIRITGGGQRAAIPQIGLVALMPDVADQIGPRDGVGGAHEDRVRDGAERLAYLGGVGDVAVRGEQECADARGVRGVAVGGFGGVYGAGCVIISLVMLVVILVILVRRSGEWDVCGDAGESGDDRGDGIHEKWIHGEICH